MDVQNRLAELKLSLKIEEKQAKIKEVEEEIKSPEFWNMNQHSNQRIKELKDLKAEVEKFKDL